MRQRFAAEIPPSLESDGTLAANLLGHKATHEERLACLDRYRDWLHAREDLQAQLKALYAKTRGGRIPLGCWCAPKECHADVLADLLGEFPELEDRQ